MLVCQGPRRNTDRTDDASVAEGDLERIFQGLRASRAAVRKTESSIGGVSFFVFVF